MGEGPEGRGRGAARHMRARVRDDILFPDDDIDPYPEPSWADGLSDRAQTAIAMALFFLGFVVPLALLFIYGDPPRELRQWVPGHYETTYHTSL